MFVQGNFILMRLCKFKVLSVRSTMLLQSHYSCLVYQLVTIVICLVMWQEVSYHTALIQTVVETTVYKVNRAVIKILHEQ